MLTPRVRQRLRARSSATQSEGAAWAGMAWGARRGQAWRREPGVGRHSAGPGVGSPGVCRRGAGPGVCRRGDKPPQQRNGEAYAMRTMAKTNAKTNVTSIITAPEKRKTSESSITRLSA